MTVDWPIKTLGDICEKITDGAHSSPKSVDIGHPMASVKDLTYFGVDLSAARLISKSDYENLTRQGCRPEVGDVLIAKDGNSALDTVCTVDTPLNAVLLSSVAILRPDKKQLDSYFLKYYFCSRQVIDYLKSNFISGAAIPRVILKDFRKAEIKLPPLEVQKIITKNLRALDKKIELNNQTNQTLEQIVQAIFKNWFVDFEPTRAKIIAKEQGADPATQELAAQAIICGAITLEQLAELEESLSASLSAAIKQKLSQLSSTPISAEQLIATAALFPNALVESELGEVPKGWGLTTLNSLLEFNPKRTLKKGTLAPYLDMKNIPTEGHLANEVNLREMTSGTKFINGDTLLARITPCLENGKTAYVDFLEEGQVAWGSTEYIVMRPKQGKPLSLGYIIARLDSFRSKAIQTMTGTSGRQRANAKALSEQQWVDYPEEILKSFDSVAGAYLAKAKQNGDEIKCLAELRDALLPKLLSGELTIEAAE